MLSIIKKLISSHDVLPNANHLKQNVVPFSVIEALHLSQFDTPYVQCTISTAAAGVKFHINFACLTKTGVKQDDQRVAL